MKQTIMKSVHALAVLFAILSIPALASETPRASVLSDQEMSSLKGQAALYGYVYYYSSGRSGASVYAQQTNWPYRFLSTISQYGGYYYIDLGNNIYQWWNNPTGWWRTWATYSGTPSNCTLVYINNVSTVKTANHYIPGNYSCY